jgi:hypothetical protein
MYPVAQFTSKDVAEATQGMGATVLKPRRAPRAVARVKQSKGFVRGSNGFAVGYPNKVFV